VRFVVGIFLLISGCTSFRHAVHRAGCSAALPENAVAPTPEAISALTGRFRLTQVVTSFRLKSGTASTLAILQLAGPDSATRLRAAQRAIGHRPRRDLRLVGKVRWDGNDQPAEWDADTLYLGCRDCLDGSPEHLHIDALTATGFWGTWIDYQTGIARIIGDDGRPLPNPAGYFCAESF